MIVREDRIIGEYGQDGAETLFVCVSAMHGNENAGVQALDLVFKMLEVEPITNPDFEFNGKIVGIIGNLTAHQVKKRYIDFDLNRSWTEENIEFINSADFYMEEEPAVELVEMKEIQDLLLGLVAKHKPKRLVVLDLHTTSARGGIFSICTEDIKSMELGFSFHAPVIKGFLSGISGTLMHYLTPERMGVPTYVTTFESGQHKEPLSINRAIASIINGMKHLGFVKSKDVVNHHDKLLHDYAENLPKLAELLVHHQIKPLDEFTMHPNFKNFDAIDLGQELANDKGGVILSPIKGLILMPLYQKQGADGFFIVKEVEVDSK